MKTKLFFSSLLIGLLANAQTYSNGGLSTGTTTANGATTSPSGYTWSELQSVGSITNTNLGFGAIYNNAGTTNLIVADDFVIPTTEKWTISSVDLFLYQTSYSGSTPPIDVLRIAIGSPDLATYTLGNMTSNIYNSSSSTDALMYRIGNNSAGTTRKVWKAKGNLVGTLDPGTYWLSFQVHATNDSSIFFPAVTIKNQLTTTDANAKQYSGTAWSDLVDAGSNAKIAVPFIINYTSTTLGVSEARQFDSRIIVYPNPTYDSFKIDIPKDALSKSTTVSLFDASGRKVKDFGILDSYDITNLKSGVYLIKINDGKNIKATQIIKK